MFFLLYPGYLFVHSLVNPFPDTTANQTLMRFNHIPIFFQIADGIAHGMRILTHKKGFG